MSVMRKKVCPPGRPVGPARKAAQAAKSTAMAETLHALAQSSAGPAVLAALEGGKRPRGRPPTGRTPDKVRKAKSRASLVDAGGRELNTPLPPEQTAQLDAIKARYGYDSDRTAVFALLALGAKRAKR